MNVWRERLGRWLNPIARRSLLSPNTITILALLLALAGAIGLALSRNLTELLVSLSIIIVAALADALDGAVARVQQKTSLYGDFLDHLCDRVADTALVIGWLIGANVRPAIALATSSLVLIHGYVGTQLEATFRHRTYDGAGRGEFIIAIVALPLLTHFTAGLRLAGFRIPELLAIVMIVGITLATLQRIAMARRLASRNDG
jgi:phosphatidylglycerophosphate synthase